MGGIRISGDIHGLSDHYLSIVGKANYSLQLGDLDFNYEFLSTISSDNHKFIGGNHSNWDTLLSSPPPHFLGRFGYTELNGIKFFFISGADSIDKKYRTLGMNWWDKEELDYTEAIACMKLYEQIKPDYVMSHDCPESIKEYFITDIRKCSPSHTNMLLESLLTIHQPKLWCFGHYHNNNRVFRNNTLFICLNELCYLDLEVRGDRYIISDTIGRPIHNSCLDNEPGRRSGYLLSIENSSIFPLDGPI